MSLSGVLQDFQPAKFTAKRIQPNHLQSNSISCRKLCKTPNLSSKTNRQVSQKFALAGSGHLLFLILSWLHNARVRDRHPSPSLAQLIFADLRQCTSRLETKVEQCSRSNPRSPRAVYVDTSTLYPTYDL